MNKKIRSISISDNIDNQLMSDSKHRGLTISANISRILYEYFQQNGIGTVIKHIPGHGLAKVDSHNYTPTVIKDINYLSKNV